MCKKIIKVISFLAILIVNSTYILANNITINVTITDIEQDQQGVIYLQACNKAGFNLALQNKPTKASCFASVAKKIENTNTNYEFTFNNISITDKEIAVFGYIDENLNNKLDYNAMGIPQEPVIFSKYLKGDPKFDTIKTTLDENSSNPLNITLYVQ